jgi:hypothetical protein
MDYRVTWVINVEADSPMDAAKQALEIQRDPKSTATIFDVAYSKQHESVDLLGEKV